VPGVSRFWRPSCTKVGTQMASRYALALGNHVDAESPTVLRSWGVSRSCRGTLCTRWGASHVGVRAWPVRLSRAIKAARRRAEEFARSSTANRHSVRGIIRSGTSPVRCWRLSGIPVGLRFDPVCLDDDEVLRKTAGYVE
jgi:hypothetical protein